LNFFFSLLYSKHKGDTLIMTRLEKINHVRSEHGWSLLVKLPNLSISCEECGTRFSKVSIDGGRCECCGNMITSVSATQIAAWEAEV
jgi:predicted Zn-ribbon and HTH transcriptional regulator